jgi:hypothetical protein
LVFLYAGEDGPGGSLTRGGVLWALRRQCSMGGYWFQALAGSG